MDLITQICDSKVENCDNTMLTPSDYFRPHSPKDLYVFGAVSLFNAIMPIIYYAVSKDYSGDYYDRNPDQDPDRRGDRDDRNGQEIVQLYAADQTMIDKTNIGPLIVNDD